MSSYTVAHLDEIEEVDDGRCPFRAVRHHLGITAFGINAWTGREAGDRIINEHDETPEDDEELYLVLSGRARFELDGEKFDAPTGTFVFVQPGVRRTAFAEDPGTTIVAVGASPGRPYEVGGWELWAPLGPLYEAGDYDAVIEQGRKLLEGDPQYPLLFYNVACCESVAGHTADALEHLQRAIELSDRCRSYARADSDFDAIREEPTFVQLVAE